MKLTLPPLGVTYYKLVKKLEAPKKEEPEVTEE